MAAGTLPSRGSPMLQEIEENRRSISPLCSRSDELESLPAQPAPLVEPVFPHRSDELENLPAQPPPIVENVSPPRSDQSTLSRPESSGITHPLRTTPPFPSSFPLGEPVAHKLSLCQLMCICLLARQKCRITADYHQLITITTVPGEENLSSISFRGTLLRGVTLRRVQCEPPARSFHKMCSFGCRSTCHLTNKAAIIRHQNPRRMPSSSSCPMLPPLLICASREEFCCERDLVALGGLEICYRDNKNDGYDPAKTQLLTIGQSFLDFALKNLRMEDDEAMRIWGEIEAGR